MHSNVPSKEELEAIRDFILLPIAMTIVDRNRQKIERSDLALKKLYARSTEVLLDRIHSDLVAVRKVLQLSQIKVIEEEHTDVYLNYRYIYRGYQDRFVMMRDVVRAEISVKLAKYIQKVFQNSKSPRR